MNLRTTFQPYVPQELIALTAAAAFVAVVAVSLVVVGFAFQKVHIKF